MEKCNHLYWICTLPPQPKTVESITMFSAWLIITTCNLLHWRWSHLWVSHCTHKYYFSYMFDNNNNKFIKRLSIAVLSMLDLYCKLQQPKFIKKVMIVLNPVFYVNSWNKVKCIKQEYYENVLLIYINLFGLPVAVWWSVKLGWSRSPYQGFLILVHNL